jgi:hypothetical protein
LSTKASYAWFYEIPLKGETGQEISDGVHVFVLQYTERKKKEKKKKGVAMIPSENVSPAWLGECSDVWSMV